MVYSSDKLIIDTPEQIPLEFSLAGVGSRALAMMIDSVIMLLIYLVLLIGGGFLAGSLSLFSSGASNWVTAVIIFLFFVVYWGYFAISEILMKGQTLGKRQLNLRVIKDSGAPMGVYEAIGRNLLRAVDFLPAFYGIGIIVAMINKQNKRLGDMIAGTVVVHERPLAEMTPVMAVPIGMASAAPPVSVYNSSRLSVDELQLIEAFLQRRYELPPALRIQTAIQIATRVCRTLEIPTEGRPDPETLLETLARERRSIGR